MEIKLKLNGKAVAGSVEADTPLLDFLREKGCYSVKCGCETSNCGLLLWATNLNILNRQQRKILLKYIQKSKNNTESVEGVKNVWLTAVCSTN